MTNKFRINTKPLPSCHSEDEECQHCNDTGIVEVEDVRGACLKYCGWCMYGEIAEEQNKLKLEED